MSESLHFDSTPYQEGVFHGPYIPFAHEEALLRGLEPPSIDPDEVQVQHQLYSHLDSIWCAHRNGQIGRLSKYALTENVKDAIKIAQLRAHTK